jgi:transketolase
MSLEMIDPRKEFGRIITEIAENDDRIVVLSADSGKSSGFGDFADKFPERYFEFGIMEQGVIGIASGLATTGKIPVFCAIAPFVTSRPFEMLRNDLGYMKQNVKVVGRNGGMTYSDLGSTHHSLEDYAITRMIPGFVVLAPQDISELRSAAKAMLYHHGPVYMRIGSQKIPKIFEDTEFEIGKGRLIKEGIDATVVTTGYILADVLSAVSILENEGISIELIGMPTVSIIDKDLILNSIKKTRKIITIEEHYILGGLGSVVGEMISEYDPIPLKRIGLPHEYISSGPYDLLKEKYNMDAKGISKRIKEFIINKGAEI